MLLICNATKLMHTSADISSKLFRVEKLVIRFILISVYFNFKKSPIWDTRFFYILFITSI